MVINYTVQGEFDPSVDTVQYRYEKTKEFNESKIHPRLCKFMN